MAEALFDAGDLEASGRAYEALTTQPAAAPVGELGLGRVAARQGRHADAVTHFERAIALFRSLARRTTALRSRCGRSGAVTKLVPRSSSIAPTAHNGRPSTTRSPPACRPSATTRAPS